MLLADFEKTHPDIKVKVDCAQGDYAEGIYAKAAAGNLPDVVLTADLYTVPFVTNGVLLDMEPFDEADDSFSFDNVYENILALGQVPGVKGTYMIPASWDSVQMYYNKNLFEEAGAPMPTNEWTWDELMAACQTIKAKFPDKYCIANGGATGWDLVGLLYPLDRGLRRLPSQRRFYPIYL